MLIRGLAPNAHRGVHHAGQQLLWGMLGATASVLAVVFDGRGQPTARLAAAIAAGFFGLMLVLSWWGGRSVGRPGGRDGNRRR